MSKKYKLSVLVYIKKKYAYGKREEQIETLAINLGGKSVGGGTDLTTGKRDQQFFFEDLDKVKTFLDYPTVREAILSEVDITNIDNLV